MTIENLTTVDGVEARPRPLTAVEAVAAVAREVGAITKARTTAAAGNFAYRGVEDFVNALAGPMARHGLVLVPHVVAAEVVTGWPRVGWSETRLTVEYDVVGPDGSTLPRPVRSFGLGPSNGATGPGVALSYAYKIAVQQLFCIPTELVDAETAAPVGDPGPTITADDVELLSAVFDQLDPDDRAAAKVEWSRALPFGHVASCPADRFAEVRESAEQFVADRVAAMHLTGDERRV